jgi:hypothetical protein
MEVGATARLDLVDDIERHLRSVEEGPRDVIAPIERQRDVGMLARLR